MQWRERILSLPDSVKWLLSVCISLAAYLATDWLFDHRPLATRIQVAMVFGLLSGTWWWFTNRKKWRNSANRFEQVRGRD
jgi:hypothetical protein